MATSFDVYESESQSALLQAAREHTVRVSVPGHSEAKDLGQKVLIG
ncbi:hypothetical protein NKDENANG_00320 [Candidatus Entotheonellaceae bacterium PAL068K]